LIVSSIALIAIVLKMSFFHDNFGVMWPTSSSGPQSHKITYLQVAIISFVTVTRSHEFFVEHPSYGLMGAFRIIQLISWIIAAHANWGFTNIHLLASDGQIGIAWNIIWFIPLDWIKFAMKATIIRRSASTTVISEEGMVRGRSRIMAAI
ncbi:hypothetical protein BKA82DRAFT_3995862, partial [Pisolithus tinctorius]